MQKSIHSPCSALKSNMCNCTAAMTGKPTFCDQLNVRKMNVHQPKLKLIECISWKKASFADSRSRFCWKSSSGLYCQLCESEGTGLASSLIRSDMS